VEEDVYILNNIWQCMCFCYCISRKMWKNVVLFRHVNIRMQVCWNTQIYMYRETCR